MRRRRRRHTAMEVNHHHLQNQTRLTSTLLLPTTDGIDDQSPDLSQSERTVVASLNGVVAIVGLSGNLLVLLSILLSRKLRTAYNTLVFNVALIDFTACLFLPWNMVALIGGQWTLPAWICSLSGSIFLGGAGVSGNTLSFIALNRYSLVTGNLKWLRKNIRFTMCGMLLVSWCVPLVVVLIPNLTDFGEIGYDQKYSMCIWVSSNPLALEYNILLSVVFGFLPIVVTTICYVKLFLFIQNHNRKIHALDKDTTDMSYGSGSGTLNRAISKRQVQVTINMFIVVCAFFLCFMPALIILVVQDPSGRLLTYTGLILQCNSCINPLIYTKNPEFRRSMGRIVQCKRPV